MRNKYLLLLVLVYFFSACEKHDIVPDSKNNLTIEPNSMNLHVDQYINTFLTAKYNGVELNPEEVIWRSKDTSVAQIRQDGFVQAIWAGKTEIIATLVNGKESAICNVSVYDEHSYKIRLTLKDKGKSNYSISNPSEFLSPKSIARRINQNCKIDETDLPISQDYIKTIEQTGGTIVAKSKWLKTVTVHIKDHSLLDDYKRLSFVESATVVWKSSKQESFSRSRNIQNSNSHPNYNSSDSLYYGSAWPNIKLNNGQVLHQQGYKGEGIDIAVIDAGFANINTNPSLNNINIKGAKSFIYENNNPFDTDSHGVWVLSCMATNKPNFFVGTAPEANYWLFRTEDTSSEFPVEQDYWLTAIEYADSAGVDIVNTSLYYTHMDLPPYQYNWQDMDGKTKLASKGANMAAKKGILIVCCAGNDRSWIGTPGDSPSVLTVGSVNSNGIIDYFTSFGLTVDGRIKPDIVALGGYASVIDVTGDIDFRTGTSYASPIICGLAACLWQAYPKKTNFELIDIIKKSSDRYNNPELPYGYGIPDMQKAIQLGKQ